MNANARRVSNSMLIFSAACAVAAALPCVAGEAASALDTVTVQDHGVPPESSAPADKQRKSAPLEENIGFFSGLAIGAVAGGPLGAFAGGITGALLGEHYHKQKVLNHTLAADLSGSNAEKAKLTKTVLELDGTLASSQAQQAQLVATVDLARDLTFNIAFRTNDANVTSEDIDQLTNLGKLAGGMDGVKIRVSGYADPRGSAQYNTELSKDRAEAVAAVLENAGIPPARIVIEALGAKGLSDTGNPDDYALQRKVIVKLVGREADAGQGVPVAVAAAEAAVN